MSILVTGASGFIGFHVCNRLLQEGREVIGVDSMNDYYDVELKKARLAMLQDHDGFTFHQFDLADHQSVLGLYELGITSIVHLAAQAGVRYSIENPIAYHQANQVATLEMLELARAIQVDHMVFASSSSVYGSNQHVLCSTQDSVDTPISYYAASKRTGELLAHSYAHLYALNTFNGSWPPLFKFSISSSVISSTSFKASGCFPKKCFLVYAPPLALKF